jgi:hypothetical protein
MPRIKSEPRKPDPFLKGRNLRMRATVMLQMATLVSPSTREALERKADALYQAAELADADAGQRARAEQNPLR